MLVKDKIIIITGASRGIGKATALLLAENGAALILISRDFQKLKELQHEILDKGEIEPFIYEADIKDAAQIKKVFIDINAKKLIPDVLVNNAGIMTESMLQMVKPELIKETFETNVFGPMLITQQAIKLMVRKRKGSIINLSSIMGTKGFIGQTIYGSSKSAIIGFTLSLSKELAPLNIRVNAISPGFIDTDMTRNTPPQIAEKINGLIGMKRIGKAEDVAKAIMFLSSDMSEYITGQVIGVDGGMII